MACNALVQIIYLFCIFKFMQVDSCLKLGCVNILQEKRWSSRFEKRGWWCRLYCCMRDVLAFLVVHTLAAG